MESWYRWDIAAVLCLALVWVIWRVMRARRHVRSRKVKVALLQRLIHNRYMVSPAYAGNRSPLEDALDQVSEVFIDSPGVIEGLGRYRESAADPANAHSLVEQRFTKMLQAMCRDVRLDPGFLASSALN